MSETATTETKATKTQKAATPKVAKAKAPRTAKAKRVSKSKAPRESREGWGTFALRLPVPERDAIHRASGPAGASRFARAVLVAFANEDEAAFKAAIVEARKLRV